MKRLLTLALMLVSCSVFAMGVPSPATPRLQVDANGTEVSAANPLPVIATGTTITSTTIATDSTGIALAVASAALSTAVTLSTDTAILGVATCSEVIVTGTSQLLASMASRLFISIQNKAATESCYINPGGTTATPGMGFEIKAGDTFERDDGPLIPYPIVCTTTASIAVGQER